MRDLDPKPVGVNYDVAHATIEGGLGGWIDSFKIAGSHLRGIAVKDFVWGKDAKGAWQAQWKPHRRGHGQAAAVLRHGGADDVRRPAADPLRVSAGRREQRDPHAHDSEGRRLRGHEEGSGASPRRTGEGRPMKRRAFLAMPAILAAAPSTDARIDELTHRVPGLPLPRALHVRRQGGGPRHDAERALPPEHAGRQIGGGRRVDVDGQRVELPRPGCRLRRDAGRDEERWRRRSRASRAGSPRTRIRWT